MTRKILLGSTVAVCLGLFFSSTSVDAFRTPGMFIGEYSPEFGMINEQLEKFNENYGTNFKFQPGKTYGIYLRGAKTRGELFFFRSETSDTFTLADYPEVGFYQEIDLNLKVTRAPFLITRLYQINPRERMSPYFGLGSRCIL